MFGYLVRGGFSLLIALVLFLMCEINCQLNCSLSTTNLFINGGFENRAVTGSSNFVNSNDAGWNAGFILGWTRESAQAEVGRGTFCNSRWGSSQVVSLDGYTQNLRISQTIAVKNNTEYKLVFKCAARESYALTTSGFRLLLNTTVLVNQPIPTNYNIIEYVNHFNTTASAVKITLQGLGTADSYGTCCDQFQLYEVFSNNLQVAVAGQCVCQSNAYNNSGTCQLCTSVDPFCNACQVVSGTYRCTTCAAGYVRAPGCFRCSTGSTCPSGSCDTASNWVSASGTCSCVTGFFNNTNVCQTCSSVMPSCLTCIHSGTLQCNSCSAGFYPNGAACAPCSTIHPACSACSGSTVCTACTLAPNWLAANGSCVCVSGYYASSNVCQPCSSGIPNCLTCTDGGSLVCDTCSAGYYANGAACEPCSLIHPACSSCSSSSFCTVCTLAPNFQPSNGTCICSPGYLLNTFNNTCQQCSQLMTNCISCSNPAGVLNCDSCSTGFYPNLTVCQPCSLIHPACSACSSSSSCSVCGALGLNWLAFNSTCVCAVGYYDDAGACTSCSVTIANCLTCSNAGSLACESCSSGFYPNGPMCDPCSLIHPACSSCSNSSSCSVCTLLPNFQPSNGTCICSLGYVLDTNTSTCQQCSLLITNCLSCSDPGTLTCDTCSIGYYPNIAACQPCFLVHPACSSCFSSSFCSVCSLLPHFQASNGSCICSPGYFLNNNTCQLCSQIIPQCQGCSDPAGILTCSSCSPGHYLDNNTCPPCSSLHPACTACTNAGVCTVCTGASWVLGNDTCVCAPGYYLNVNTGTCLLCSLAIGSCQLCSNEPGNLTNIICDGCAVGYYPSGPSCQTCSLVHPACTLCLDSHTCTTCTGAHWQLNNGTCLCEQFYFENTTIAQCVACAQMHPQCLICQTNLVSTVTVYTCLVCQWGYYPVGDACVPCTGVLVGCSNCSMDGLVCYNCDESSDYYLDSYTSTLPATTCTLCSMTGCTDCFSLFRCSACNETAQYFLNSSSEQCVPCPLANCLECETFTSCSVCNQAANYFLDTIYQVCQLCDIEGCSLCMNLLQCSVCDIDNNYLMDNTTTLCFRCELELCRRCITNYTCEVCEYGYIVDSNLTCVRVEESDSQFVTICGREYERESNNVLELDYNWEQCARVDVVQTTAKTISYASYATLFLSVFSGKIVGLELFGVLQMSYFNLADQEFVNLYLQPLLDWRFLNGYNLEPGVVTEKQSSRLLMQGAMQGGSVVPDNVRAIGYFHSFLDNMNIMLLVMIAQLVISAFLVVLSTRFICLRPLAMFLLKQVFLSLFIFNSFNIAFSVGLHFKYATPHNTPNYFLSTAAAFASIGLTVVALGGMLFLDGKDYGEFRSKFKKGFLLEMYIVISIAYRLVLGVYMALGNEDIYTNLFILVVSMAYLLYNVVNLPFTEAYQNYRANLCHGVQLAILMISNFYSVILKNDPLEERGRIFTPAMVQIYLLILCIGVSLICLIYELQLFMRRLCQRTNRAVLPVEKSSMNAIITTEAHDNSEIGYTF